MQVVGITISGQETPLIAVFEDIPAASSKQCPSELRIDRRSER